jgi:nitrate reductase gamma subunit
MAYIPTVVAYIGLGVFLVACAVRVAMWIRMPMHVRWELYPVAHEPGRAHYGGSYLEMAEWWKRPRETSLVGEARAMGAEILFLVALKEHNPKMWWRSFPFHFGLYLVIGSIALMVLTGILSALAPSAITGSLASAAHWVILVPAIGGVGLSWLGAVGLLHARLTHPDLRDFTAPADVFNLVFFIITFGLVLAHFGIVDRNLTQTVAFVQGLVTFSPVTFSGTPFQVAFSTATVTMMAALLAYIPLTHMSHFIGKYFSYHAIRWNDAPNLRGSHEEKPIQELLSQPVTWAAPHIEGNGKKTWLDLATEEVKK